MSKRDFLAVVDPCEIIEKVYVCNTFTLYRCHCSVYTQSIDLESAMPSKESKREKAKEVVDILEEISILLVR